MVKRFFSLLGVGISALFCMLQAEESPLLEKDDAMFVNSGEAQYDGKEIVLIGQVAVQHSIGQISARRLSVSPSSIDKKRKFNFLKMNDDVQVELKGGGRLDCQQAEVDYAKMQGVFLGNDENPDVTYLNVEEGKEISQKIRPPLEVKSYKMILDLVREPSSPSTSSKTLVNQIEAIQNVRVQYNQDYLLLADHALYQRMPTSTTASNAGFLTLSVRDSNPSCQMTNMAGDRLNAQTIRIHTAERQLWLDQPRGMLKMRDKRPPPQTLEFSANELLWNDQKHILQLKGQVNVTQNGTLHIQTPHEISIAQALIGGKKTLSSIQSLQDTKLSYLDIQKGNTRHIYCSGPLMIDHERQIMTLQSLINETGQVEENQQVYIEDVLGEMYADHVQLHYTWEGQQVVPHKVTLEGHVRLLNRFDGHPEESGSILHYALADRVDYSPKQNEMVLDSTKGHRVLFFDKVNNVQMSAPSLQVKHDPNTQKNAIQGRGDVRFTFMDKELKQLKHRFQMEESFQKESGNAR